MFQFVKWLCANTSWDSFYSKLFMPEEGLMSKIRIIGGNTEN